jgi:hypothetical protein
VRTSDELGLRILGVGLEKEHGEDDVGRRVDEPAEGREEERDEADPGGDAEPGVDPVVAGVRRSED